MITYQRAGGHHPPRDAEYLRISDDGGFQLWRSVGWATNPPSGVGFYSGRLDDAEAKPLGTEAAAAVAAGDLRRPVLPDSPVERLAVNGVAAEMGIHDEDLGAWLPVAQRARRLLGELTVGHATAAVDLEVDAGRARLVHRGETPLPLDLGPLAVETVRWRQQLPEGSWRTPDDALAAIAAQGRTTAPPGWQLDIPVAPSASFEAGDDMDVTVTLVVYNGDRAIPVSLQRRATVR